MTAPRIAPDDPLFQPLTMREVLDITGRSRRTIEKWVASGRLTKYEQRNRRNVVIGHVYNENEVVDTEQERSAAARENRDRIRRRGGRPGQRETTRTAGLDEKPSEYASLPCSACPETGS